MLASVFDIGVFGAGVHLPLDFLRFGDSHSRREPGWMLLAKCAVRSSLLNLGPHPCCDLFLSFLCFGDYLHSRLESSWVLLVR